MSENTLVTTDDSFDADVLQSTLPVLVDFWAQWCGPCRMLAPVVDEVAKEYVGKVKVMKMDVDANAATPAKYGIRSIPSLLLFKNGDVVATKVGAMNKSQLAAFLDEHK